MKTFLSVRGVRKLARLPTALLMMSVSAASLAVDSGRGFGDLAGDTWTTQSTGLIQFAEVAAVLVGIFMVLIGIFKFAHTPQGQPKGQAITLIIAGGAIASISALMAFGSMTISGDSRGGDKINELIGSRIEAPAFHGQDTGVPTVLVVRSIA